jgi:lipopolysaccharide export system permease protein
MIIAIDSMELIKKSGTHVISLDTLIAITCTKLPFIIQEVFVFLIFFASISTFFFIAKHGEYVALRSVGVSVWRFLFPIMAVSVVISIVLVTLVNPISAALLNYSTHLEKKISGKDNTNYISILGREVWLLVQDKKKNENYIISASKLKTEGNTTLTNPKFIFFNNEYALTKVLQADTAIMEGENWVLSNYNEYLPYQTPKRRSSLYRIKNSLDVDALQKNFKDPRGVSIWQLPALIKALESTGYPTSKYYAHLYKLLIKPLLMPAVIFFTAAFMLKYGRLHRTSILLTSCVIIFIALYCATELALNVQFQNKLLQALNFLFVAIVLNLAGILLIKFSERR